MRPATEQIIHFRGSKVYISPTHLYKKGNVISVKVPEPFTFDTYLPRHIMWGPGKTVSHFPNNPEQIIEYGNEIGDSWPSKGMVYNVTDFQLVALEDNATFYCVHPDDDFLYLDVEERTLLIANSTRTFEPPSIVFVIGTNYSVNGKKYTQNEIFAVEFDDFTITAHTDTYMTVVTPCEIVYSE